MEAIVLHPGRARHRQIVQERSAPTSWVEIPNYCWPAKMKGSWVWGGQRSFVFPQATLLAINFQVWFLSLPLELNLTNISDPSPRRDDCPCGISFHKSAELSKYCKIDSWFITRAIWVISKLCAFRNSFADKKILQRLAGAGDRAGYSLVTSVWAGISGFQTFHHQT